MLRFVDQEPDDPIQIAGLSSPNNPAPKTFEQSDPLRQRWIQEQIDKQNSPSINLQKDIDHSTPRLQRLRQLLDSEPADPFFKERFYDELTEETLA